MKRPLITRRDADAVRTDLMQSVTPADVAVTFWRFFDALRNTGTSTGEMRTTAIYRVWRAGVEDALTHITKSECVPDFDPDEEPMEGEQ